MYCCKCSRYEHLLPLIEVWIKLTRPQGHPLIPTGIKCLTAWNWRLLPIAHKYRGNLDLHTLPAVLGVILPHILDEVHLLQTFVPWRPRYMLGSAMIRKKTNKKAKSVKCSVKNSCQLYDQMAALACRTSDIGVEEGGGRRGLHATS